MYVECVEHSFNVLCIAKRFSFLVSVRRFNGYVYKRKGFDFQVTSSLTVGILLTRRRIAINHVSWYRAWKKRQDLRGIVLPSAQQLPGVTFYNVATDISRRCFSCSTVGETLRDYGTRLKIHPLA